MPNPGRMAVGLVLTGPDGSHHRAARRLPHTGCNNEAELTALLDGLQAAQQAGAQALRIYTDSHVLLEQLAPAPGRPPRPIVRLEPLPHLNSLYAALVAAQYMGQSGEGVDPPYGALSGLVRKVRDGEADVYSAAEQLREWRI